MSETTLESKMENLLNQKKQVKLEIFEYKEGLSIREKLGDEECDKIWKEVRESK